MAVIICPLCDGLGEWDEALPSSDDCVDFECARILCAFCQGSGEVEGAPPRRGAMAGHLLRTRRDRTAHTHDLPSAHIFGALSAGMEPLATRHRPRNRRGHSRQSARAPGFFPRFLGDPPARRNP